MQKQIYDIIVYGGVCCDMILSGVKRLPNPGEEVWAESMKMTVGGSFNVAAAAARLNLKTGMPCVLGEDLLSEFIRTTAKEEGIDTRLIYNTRGSYEQLSIVLNFGHDRAFLSYADQSMQKEYEQHLLQISQNHSARTAVFGMSGNGDMKCLMNALKAEGTEIILDCSWDEEVLDSDELKDLIRTCDYFLPNLDEARRIAKKEDPYETAAFLAELAPDVVIKMGSEGAIHGNGEEIVHYPAIDLGEAIDTTGAGDNFAAGFAYGLVKGEDIKTCIMYGQLCGSKSVIAVGGFTASLYESELNILSRTIERKERIG